VIEGIHVLQFLEARFLMALRAIRSEFSFVRILVTGCTLIHPHALPIREHTNWITRLCMARVTIRGLVLSIQFEDRCIVIKTSLSMEDRERFFSMALGTRANDP